MAKSTTPSNVANPSLYSRVKAEAKRKFDVFPSAYASAWLVKTYKKEAVSIKELKRLRQAALYTLEMVAL